MSVPQSPGSAVAGPSERQYKACRTCRRQKMRCDADEGIPCSRCQKSDSLCVFDTPPAKRQAQTPTGPNKKQKLQHLTDEVANLKSQLASLKRPQETSGLSSRETGSINSMQTLGSEGIRREMFDGDHALSSDKLSVPVTAVHVFMAPPQDGEPERSPTNWTVENQSRWNRFDTQNSQREDIVACLKISEVEARALFDRFMQGANTFLSLFDPHLDTFDSIRERSPFTLAAILYVALSQQHSQSPDNPTLKLCFDETRRLAADSLFENPSSLEKGEAMILLAIYAEKTWFALGHTYQIAYDLGLDRITLDLVSRPLEYANPGKAPRASRLALRCAKLWLLVLLYERGLAFGTLRPSRGQNFRLENLEPFLDINTAHPAIISPCASIDLHEHFVLLRRRTVLPSIRHFEDDIAAWYKKWDKRLEDSCVHTDSLHRSHLRIQELYALCIHGGMSFARTYSSNQPPQDRPSEANETSLQIGTHILHRAKELFTFIETCGAYKRVFPCTPTYECLLLTFVIILGFHILRAHPALATEQNYLEHVEHAVSLIKQHPCQRFHNVVSQLLDTARSSPPFQQNLRQDDVGGNYINVNGLTESMFAQQGEEWMFDMSAETFFSLSGGVDNAAA